jgi:hypothetical protein
MFPFNPKASVCCIKIDVYITPRQYLSYLFVLYNYKHCVT